VRTSRLEIRLQGGPVRGVHAATKVDTFRRGLSLRIRTPDGLEGRGEASPLPGYSKDGLEEAEGVLSSIDWSRLPEPEDPDSAVAGLDALSNALPDAPASARFAAETAWLDLLGQRALRPVWSLLAPQRGDQEVPLCSFVGAAGDAGVVQAAAAAARRGAHTVKIKVTGPRLGAQHAVLRRIREAIGPCQLRLDANRSLSPDSAAADLEQLCALAPELVEEPVPTAALPCLMSPVPIALDESLQDPGVWASLAPHLEHLRCAAMVLKPMALGGIRICLELAARAAERGLDVTVSHLFDGPVALAASAHLAVAIASRSRASGLDRHAGLAAWPDIEVPIIGGATLKVSAAPGLGIPRLPEPA